MALTDERVPFTSLGLADAIPGAKAIEINGWLVVPDVVCDAIETGPGVVAERLLPH